MIQLRSDCLVFRTSDGEDIPCSAEAVTIEMIGDASHALDPEVVRNASFAVLHYFKIELGRSHVTVGEFSHALEVVLRSLGFEVNPAAEAAPGMAESDLCELADETASGFELAFFPRLREELRRQLGHGPRVLRFTGLRGCVKQLAGAKRWSGRCQRLSDQIVDYLREVWGCENRADGARSLVVE